MIFETEKFGGISPYFVASDHLPCNVIDSMQQAIHLLPEGERIIDPVGIMQELQFNYMCGTRTLVKGIKRMPWRAMLDSGGSIKRHLPIEHGHVHLSPADAAKKLCGLLEEELLEAIAPHAKVYILLTGGLDSRLVAGVLHRARAEIKADITCVTWGLETSRDVQYAKRIADWFGWNFVHVPLNPDIVWSNLECMATWGGAEISGLHLHNMNWFKNVSKDALVIAGSFGDSVGRAEFSGKNVLQLCRPEPTNPSGLIHPYLEEECLRQSAEDIATAWELLDSATDYVKWEHHQQENYMRRMICHAMDRIRVFTNLHQAFTSDAVVEFMWSLCPTMRDDSIYWEAFKSLDPRLFSLPWARSGIAPDGVTQESDNSLLLDYHKYGSWCRDELRERIEECAFNRNLYNLGFLFAPALNNLYKSWKRYGGGAKSGVVENVTKLAQIEIARRHYDLHPVQKTSYLKDHMRACKWKIARGINSSFQKSSAQ